MAKYAASVNVFIHVFACIICAQDYYPMTPGNEWQYQQGDGFNTFHGQRIVIVKDTVLNNDKQYFEFDGEDIVGGKYLRYDSGCVTYYDPGREIEFPMFNFYARPDTFISFEADFNGILGVSGPVPETLLVLGDSIEVLKFELGNLTAYQAVYLSKALGPVYSTIKGAGPIEFISIKGAKISGVEFGDLTHLVYFQKSKMFGFVRPGPIRVRGSEVLFQGKFGINGQIKNGCAKNALYHIGKTTLK